MTIFISTPRWAVDVDEKENRGGEIEALPHPSPTVVCLEFVVPMAVSVCVHTRCIGQTYVAPE